MRLLLETSASSFQVTRAAEARKDFGKDVQKVDRDTGRPQWVVEVLAQDAERGGGGVLTAGRCSHRACQSGPAEAIG